MAASLAALECASSLPPMSSQAIARQLGNRGAGRTQIPSVGALSEFLHTQGQQREWDHGAERVRKTLDNGRDCRSAKAGRSGRVEDGRGSLGPKANAPFSHPSSSNRACRFPALGFPIGFTTRPTIVGRIMLASSDDTLGI